MATSPPILTLSADQSEVKAGGTILLTAVLAHGGPDQGEFALSIRGIDATWATFYPPTLSVAAGGQATATILIAPPINAAAADLALTVRAVGTGANAEAEATFSVRLVSTTSGATGKARAPRRLTWPRLLLISAGVVVVIAAVGTFFLLRRHPSPPPPPAAACASQPTQLVDLYSDDTTTAIRISDPDLADVRILRTEPSDTLSPLFSSLLSLSSDGTRLAYVTAGNEALDDAHLWSLDIANPGQRQELATIPHGLWQVRPAWSSDNRQVAFLRLNDQQAAAGQNQLELWVAEVGGQPRKVAAPPELRPDGFYGSATQPLCWAQDNRSVIFSSVTRDSSPTDQGSRAAGAAQSASDTAPGTPQQIAVDVQTGATEQLASPTAASDAAQSPPPAPAGGAGCGLPVFSQNDPAWRNVIMQSSGDTIGRFGCAVTATAMLLNYYGTTLTPAQLNTCLGDKADLIQWTSVVPCANGAITASNAFDFAWPSLDQVLASGNPAIVGMVRGQTGLHFVVVTAGGGGEATNYPVVDPWDGTTSKTLQTFLDAGYNLRWIRTYTGTDKECPRLIAPQTPAGDASGIAPVPDGPLLAPSQLLPFFTKVSEQTGVPRDILLSIARVESGFTPRSVGPLIERFSGTEDAHALGMMQFLPSTYRTYSAQVDAARSKSASAGTFHALQVAPTAPGIAPLGDAGIWDPESSIWATAFFLQQHGFANDQHGAIFAYNNSDAYVDLVLKTAQQFKANTIPDPNLYDPNSTSKPGTLAAPNPVNPPPLSPADAAAAAALSPTTSKQANGSAAQANGGPSGGSAANGGAPGTAGGANGGSGGAPGGANGGASGGGGASDTTAGGTGGGTVPIRWSVPEGSISRSAVQLNFNATDNIGDIVKLSLLTLTVPGSTASPVNQSTPSRPFTPGTVITDDGVYEAVATTRQNGQTRVSRRKFTIDRTAPGLELSVIDTGGAGATATTPTAGATQAVTTADALHPVANGAIRLKIGYTDTLSGVASVEYRIDGGDWQLYFNAVAFKGDALIDVPGDHRITVRATDVAGNVSSERSLDFTVKPDPNRPVAAGTFPGLHPISSNLSGPSATVVAVVTDATATTVGAATATVPVGVTPTVAITPTTASAASVTPTATQETGTPTAPTALPPTVAPTATFPFSLNPIAVTRVPPTATTVVTPTVTTTTPTAATETPVVTPTVAITATAVPATPTTSPTPAPQTATPATTATVTLTVTPSPAVKILAPSCSDAAVKTVASCTSVAITNAGTTDLHINNINTSGEFLIGEAGSTCTTALAPGAVCDIPILFIPTTVGKRVGSLTITDSSPESPHTVALAGNGIGAPAVTFAPPLFTCPDTQLGQSSHCSVTLTNTGSAELTIASGIVVTGDFEPDPQNTDCGLTLAVSAHCTLGVVFSPVVHGIRTGVLTITDSAPGSPHPISLTGKGLAPSVSLSAGFIVSPSSIVCKDANVGDPPTQCLPDTTPLTLTNTGDGVLNVSSIIPHDDFIRVLVGDNCLTLDPGQSCTLPLFFAPAARGVFTSGLTFTDNAVGSPQTVQITAKGLAPVVSLSPLSIPCPPTIVGQTSVCLVPSPAPPGTVTPTPPGAGTPLSLTNTGDADLKISSIVPNDDFIKIDTAACPATVVPGAVCTLRVSFAPTRRGAFTSGLSINDNALGTPHTVQITAQGLAPVVSLAPQSLACPDTIVGTSSQCVAAPGDPPTLLTLTNSGDAPLNISSIVPNDAFIKVDVSGCPASLPKLQSCALPVSFIPAVRGDFASGLTITDDAVGSPHAVQITAKGLAPIASLSPQVPLCPETIVGTSSACAVPGEPPTPLTLTNTGDAPLSVASIVASDDFKVAPGQCPAPLAQGEACQIAISFVPVVRGNHVGNVVISDNAPGSPHTVQLTAKGLAPVFSLIPTSLTCPNTIVGQSTSACTPAAISFTNTGDAPLTIASIVTRDDFQVAPGVCPQTFAPGASCTLPVTFAPTTRGSHVGNIVIADNAPGSPHSVQLSGTGLAPVVNLSATAVTCPDTAVGLSTIACTPATVTLTNSGDAVLKIDSILPSSDFTVSTPTGGTACGATLVGGANCNLQIRFAPTVAGVHQGNLAIADNAPGSPHTVQLTAKGLAPVALLSTRLLACPDTIVGQTAACASPLTLTNTGDAPLNIGSVVPSDDFIKIDTANCPATVAPNGVCTLAVSFAPTRRGTFTSGLAVNDNALGSPHTVQITAKGLAPAVNLSATSLTCPTTIVGQSAVCGGGPLTLTNAGDAPLNIASIVANDDFTIAALPTGTQCGATLGAGAACSVQIGFAPKARGNHTGNVVIADDAPGSPHTVQLTGTGLAPVVSLSAASLACPDTQVGQSPAACTPALTLTNNGDAPLTVSSVVATDDFTVTTAGPACGGTIAPAGTCALQVSFAPKTAGSHTGSVTILDNAPGSPHAVQLTGTGLAAIATLSTASVACGGTPVGTTAICPLFTLSNTGTTALTITNIVLAGDFTGAVAPSCGTVLQPGVICQVTVTFGPTAAGSRVGSLTIADNAPGSPQVVALSGLGQAPVVALSAPSLACVDTAVGATGACGTPLTLTNNGDAPLTISSVVTSDDFKVTAGACPTTLASAANCPITVTFAPTTGGSHVGGLTITDNASGSPHSVQLTGTGLAPVVTLSTQTVDCTGTLIGTTIACPVVTLTNSGTAPLSISSIVLSGDFAATISPTCGTSVPPTTVCQITATFGPTAAGTRTGSLTISDNAAGSPHAIALSGTGKSPPIVALSPSSSLACPPTTVGTTGTCGTGLTLTNSGDAPLTISSIAATDEFQVGAAATGGCGTALAANATHDSSCALQVTFAPTTPGNHTGSITIVDNAAGSPHAVQLIGTALAPVASFDVSSVSCPDTAVGGTNPCPTITLSNTGNAPLHLTSIVASSPFQKATDTCGTADLGPGANCQINVVFAPAPGTFGNLTGFLTVTDNAPGSPHKVPLSGNGIGTPAVTVTAAGTCPDTPVGTTAPCTTLVTVANGSAATGNLVLSLITISSEFGIDASRSTCGTTLTPGSNCVLAISFTPAADGTRNGSVTITDNAPGSPHSVALTGKGLGTPAITLAPATLACPDTLVGTTASCPTRVTIANAGTAQLTLTLISLTGDYALDSLTGSTCGTAVAPGTSCALAISFTPTAPGARTGSLQVTDNAPASPQTVPLTGNGTQPALALAPAAIACPPTLVGVKAVCSTTVTNAGTAPLTMSAAITVGGGEFVIDTTVANSCGAALASSASCTLAVDFTPTATGAQTGSLKITDNAPGNPHTVALSGTGTQPVVALSTTSITCADTAVGTTGICQQVTVQNTGTGTLTFSQPPATVTPFATDATRTTCGATLAAGASCSIGMTFTPGATTGPRTGTLSITDTAPSSPQSVSLAGNGVATTPTLTVAPASATCTSAAVGATSACTLVTLTNSSATTALTLTLPFTAAGDFAIGSTTCTGPLAASASCTLAVTFTPTATGVRNGTATIAYTAGAGTQTAVIPYSGTGT